MNAAQKFAFWMEQVPEISPIHQELLNISEDGSEIEARFGADLTFGTAGLRGIMGAGTDRMNVYTVRRAALAYGQYIKAAELPDTCVIAYDTRNHSRLFSETCAAALAETGIHVYLFPEPMPTPVLSFAVRELGTGGGVVMTASHNPAAYNGMKCYGNDGCQQTDTPAAEVFARMQTLPMISEPEKSFEAWVSDGAVELLEPAFYEKYYAAVLGEGLCPDIIPDSGLKVLYTPLHGTGLKPVTTLFDRLGVDYEVVASQTAPDGNFPTCSYPNPESEGAFDEAKRVLETGGKDFDLIIATDPDADRVAVAVPQKDGSLKRLSGNELGCLLLDYILRTRQAQGNLPKHSKCIKSIVTTPMVLEIAKKYGCENIDVLTGFKYIGSTILDLERQGREDEVIFAFEESCGFLKGTYARDKDAQVACILVCELAAACNMEGLDLSKKLEQLYQAYGYYKTQVVSVELNGEAGKQRCADYIGSLRKKPFTVLGGIAVEYVADYQDGCVIDCRTGEKTELHFPKSNVLSYQMGGSQVILRPSGTEPKLKIYYFAADPAAEKAENLLKKLKADMQKSMASFGI